MSASLLLTGVTFVVMGAWYLQANRTWIRLLEGTDEGPANDPIRHPYGWARSAPYRMATLLRRIRSPEQDPSIEESRRRTLNGFVVLAAVTSGVFWAGDAILGHVARFVEASVVRYGIGFGILTSVDALFILGYYSAQLGRSLNYFGNGRSPTALELAVAAGGIVAVLIAMAILPNLDLAKPR